MRGTGQGGTTATGGANSATSVSNGVAPVTSSDQWPPSAVFRLARKPVLSFHRAKPTNSPLFTADSRLDVVDIGRAIYARNKPTVNRKVAPPPRSIGKRYMCAALDEQAQENGELRSLLPLRNRGAPLFALRLYIVQHLCAQIT